MSETSLHTNKFAAIDALTSNYADKGLYGYEADFLEPYKRTEYPPTLGSHSLGKQLIASEWYPIHKARGLELTVGTLVNAILTEYPELDEFEVEKYGIVGPYPLEENAQESQHQYADDGIAIWVPKDFVIPTSRTKEAPKRSQDIILSTFNQFGANERPPRLNKFQQVAFLDAAEELGLSLVGGSSSRTEQLIGDIVAMHVDETPAMRNKGGLPKDSRIGPYLIVSPRHPNRYIYDPHGIGVWKFPDTEPAKA